MQEEVPPGKKPGCVLTLVPKQNGTDVRAVIDQATRDLMAAIRVTQNMVRRAREASGLPEL